jgi:hypothetical protein
MVGAGRLEEQLVRDLVVERRLDGELTADVAEEIGGGPVPSTGSDRDVDSQAPLDSRTLERPEELNVLVLRPEVKDGVLP